MRWCWSGVPPVSRPSRNWWFDRFPSMAVRRVFRSLSRGRSEKLEDPQSPSHHRVGILARLKPTGASNRTQRDRNPSQPLPPVPLAAISADEAAQPCAAAPVERKAPGLPMNSSYDFAAAYATSRSSPRDSPRHGPSLVGRRLPSFRCEALDAHGAPAYAFDTDRPTGTFTLVCLFKAGDELASCEAKMYKMEELWTGYRRQDDCRFLAISIAQSVSDLRAFRADGRCRLTVPMAPDPDGHIAGLFDTTRVPQFYLLDDSYTVVQQSCGHLSSNLLAQISTLYQDANVYVCTVPGVKADATMRTANRAPKFPQPISK